MLKTVVLCGHNKCGTSWIRDVINTVPSIKLIHFNELMEKDCEYFIDLAKSDSRVLFFHCPFSIQNPESVAKLIQIDSAMGAIIIYREPIAAMISMHNYQRWGYGKGRPGGPRGQLMFDQHIRDKDLVKSIISGKLREQFEATFRYDINALTLRTNFSCYLELLYDDFERNEEEFLLRILNFIEVKPAFTLPEGRVNRSMAVRSLLADKLIIKIFYLATGIEGSHLRRLYRNRKLRRSIFLLLMDLNSKPSQLLSSSEKERLREFVRPMVTEFVRITGLDVTSWGHDL